MYIWVRFFFIPKYIKWFLAQLVKIKSGKVKSAKIKSALKSELLTTNHSITTQHD
jgi:hypothetical protein